MVILASVLPDCDSRFNSIGSKIYFRPVQFFVKHRGIMHSFLFLVLISLIISLFFSEIALAFFLGYGLHLLADSFTIVGISALWPFKFRINGSHRTGSFNEELIFLAVFLLIILFSAIQFSEYL
jgi:inner membrane protein